MKYIIILALSAVSLIAQIGPPGSSGFTPVTSDPTGRACQANAVALQTPNGKIYTCVSGVYVLYGGGSGTVTSVTGTAPVQSSGGTTPAISVNGLAGITGAVKANGSGAVTQAGCADLSNAGTGCTGAAPPSGTGTVQVTGGTPGLVSGTSSNCVLVNGTSAPCDAPGQGAVGNVTPVTANANSTSAQALMEIAVPTGLLNVATGASNGTALIHGSGIFTIQTLQVPTIAITTKICTVSGCGSGTAITLATNVTTATVAATANTWNLNLKVATVATGSSGTLLAHGALAIDIGATSAVADSVFNDSNTAATSAINLTGTLYVDFFITFSAQPTTPFNSFTQQVGSLEPASAIGPTGATGPAGPSPLGVVTPEAYGAVGNGGFYFDGAMAATKTIQSTSSTSTTPTSPATTTVSANDIVLNVWATNASWSAAPSTGTNRVNLTFVSSGYGLTMNEQTIASAGSVSASTGTTGSSTIWSAGTIPLKPSMGSAGTFVAQSGVKQTSGTTLTLSVPGGTANGNMMVACIGWYRENARYHLIAPLGWTPIFTQFDGGTPFTSAFNCYYRIASSEPSSYVWQTPSNFGTSGFIATYSGIAGVDGDTLTLTSSSANFPANAAGDLICINGVPGTSGINGALVDFLSACGTITTRNSATSVVVSGTMEAVIPQTSLQFTYGASDQSAFNTMLTTAPCSTIGCRVELSNTAYMLSSGFTLTPFVTTQIVGISAGIPNAANNFLNSSALSNSNTGSRLVWATQSMVAPALTLSSGTNTVVSGTDAYSLIQDVGLIGGGGYGRDGGGSDGVVIKNWLGVALNRVSVFGFSGRGVYVDILVGGTAGYVADVSLTQTHVTFTGGPCLQLGGVATPSQFIQAIASKDNLYEGCGGPGWALVAPKIFGLTSEADIFQWNNVLSPGTEIDTTGSVGAGSVTGAYFEVDVLLGSQDTDALNNPASTAGNIGLYIQPDANIFFGIFTPTTFSGSGAAAIPAASSYRHMSTCVSDAVSVTVNATYTSGGTNTIRVISNGTNWLSTGSSDGCF